MGIQQMLLGSKLGPTPDGQQQYGSSGTYTWTPPFGVTSFSVVCIGGGGAGGGPGASINSGGPFGGGGGACAYKNNISVSAGTSYTIVVGAGAQNSKSGEPDGGDSSLSDGSTVLCKAAGGWSCADSAVNGGTAYGGTTGNSIGDGKYKGGNGGGSGGAGQGGNGSGSNGQGGTGGGGGGGNAGTVSGSSPTNGSNGIAGTSGYGGYGGSWGGGGGGTGNNGTTGWFSAGGFVRIIWQTSGTTREFPGTNIGNL